MKAVFRACALAVAALALTGAPHDSEARPYGRGGGYHGSYGHSGWGHDGRFWGGVGLGLGLGFGTYYALSPWYPGVAYVVPPAPVYEVVSPPPPPVQVTRAAPDPIIYPNRGQSAAQTEADRQACNRWATSQPSAMADASVFHRATLACMEGRGYTLK
ncbi:MAG: hypothetical protein ABIV63_13905 [Caldimonas sp.]